MSNKQEYELEEIVRAYSHSIKLSETQKGVRIDVHCYGNSSEEVRKQTLQTYLNMQFDLTEHNIPRAPMSMSAINGGGKE